ncbi:MAG: VWA domain-containing protein [Acidobacteria bacterium]|nr:VWA domain-containing protein [Acidobacteriota bacterium]
MRSSNEYEIHVWGRIAVQTMPRVNSIRVVIFVTFVATVVFVSLTSAQIFRARVETVQVTVTVHDAEGRLITGLTKDDFEIFEDGEPQPVTQFTNERVPVSLGVLLDASDSMRGQPMSDALAAVDRFVGALLESEDEAFVAAFNHLPRVVAPWTRPPSVLRGRLDEFRPSGSTAIYDALVAAAPLFERRTHTRAALVVVSDGADTASDRTLQQARAVLRRTDPFVYAIAIDSAEGPASTRVNADALREITGPSGGYTEVVHSAQELGPATERIANELNTQYTLGYTPSRSPDGAWREIRVRVKDRGYFTRARRGYYAVPTDR